MAFIPNAAFQVVAPPPNTQWQCWEEFQKTPKELVGKPSSSSNSEFLKPNGFQLSKRFRMFGRNDDVEGGCGCCCGDFFPGNQAPRHRKVHERGGFVPLQICTFCLCKLNDTTRCLGKIKILIHVSSFRLFACEVLWRCGHLATTEHCRATTSRLEVASTDDGKDFF